MLIGLLTEGGVGVAGFGSQVELVVSWVAEVDPKSIVDPSSRGSTTGINGLACKAALMYTALSLYFKVELFSIVCLEMD